MSSQIDELKEKFQSLSQSEQKLLVACSMAIIAYLFYLLLWQPVMGSVEKARKQRDANQELVNWMMNKEAELKLLQASSAGKDDKRRGQSMNQVVNNSSRQFRLPIEQFKSQQGKPDELLVTIKEGEFNQVVMWLNELQSNYQLSVLYFSVTQVEEQPGMVKARIRFKDQAK